MYALIVQIILHIYKLINRLQRILIFEVILGSLKALP